ncbi:uncharacterized protein LOC117110759 [Anneissia japonica]|uniref:uncharacterized protein LOC117110759 n=1 Tax=Anneissia japonica TaxID=1529436 RepID=UPI00142590DE|nr:uncharacterized protein LOC117110759 [Anneissia japonica]XP_033109457.1 uncharacterized protein LOC117110759 [Anneissia japonica]
MAVSKEFADADFGGLKLDVSKWFDRCRYGVSMLKVLYNDHVKNNYALHECSKTMDIIELLIGAGHLTPDNLTLLYETIKVTQQFGLKQLIKDRHPSFLIPKDIKNIVITEFTMHRQRLVNLGMALTPEEIQHISGLYNVAEEHAADSWRLIIDLEQRLIICEEEMEEFIKNLKKHDLPKAVKALTEDTSNASSNTREPSGEEVTDANFRGLKLDISKWYDRCICGVSMLKVLYRDQVKNNYSLHRCSKTMDIIELLTGARHLTQINLTLLYETITLTQQFGLEDLIKNRYPAFQIPKDIRNIAITKFTLHRQRLVNLGMELIPNEIQQISGLYSVVKELATDSWSLIMDLENRLIISEGEMEALIKNLKKNDLPRAVKALTQDMTLTIKEHTSKAKPLKLTSLKQRNTRKVTTQSKAAGSYKIVRVDSKPIKQSPMIAKAPVQNNKLVNTIILNERVTDVIACEDDCLLVSQLNGIVKYKQSGEYMGRVIQNAKVKRMFRLKNGNIVFSDFGDKSIKVCNMNDLVIKSIGKGTFKFPAGIHVDETSNILYVADWNYGRVVMFDIVSGRMTRCMGSVNIKEDQMKGVADVALTNQGQLLVLEYLNNRLKLYEPEGKFIKVLVEAGNENGKLIKPYGVVVDQDDNIIITSEHKLQLFSSDGNFIKRIDKPEDGINNPRGLSIISYNPHRVVVANDVGIIKIFNY